MSKLLLISKWSKALEIKCNYTHFQGMFWQYKGRRQGWGVRGQGHENSHYECTIPITKLISFLISLLVCFTPPQKANASTTPIDSSMSNKFYDYTSVHQKYLKKNWSKCFLKLKNVFFILIMTEAAYTKMSKKLCVQRQYCNNWDCLNHLHNSCSLNTHIQTCRLFLKTAKTLCNLLLPDFD